ncbi:hypothetical protein ABW20_dc0108892 [Dactylellina cionopaga]|nr:hypothetical protein ABW20_dc0108892 [Dactylellina cionopaga]
MFSLLPFFYTFLALCNIVTYTGVAAVPISDNSPNALEARAAPDNFWLTQMTHGSSVYAPAGYPIFRNVKDYGAKGDGVTDDTDAINAAAKAGGRCEGDCGSSSVLGAIVYFPSGTYKISKPIFQHYYTQFIGNPNDRPTLKATANFKGIALIDSDFYIPGGDGSQWYINQSNFYRQIRNLILDITALPPMIHDGDSSWPPVALHWQVAQATSLYNIHFVMSTAGNTNQTGIFMENGSGGFMSDLTFYGGQFGMRCGAQQFTARDLHFTSCITAIQMIWDWTWTWKNIYIYSCWVGIDVTGDGSSNGQPVGAVTIMDSSFASVPIAVLTSGQTNINLDNVKITDCNIVVGKPGGPTLLAGGNRVIASKPQYESLSASAFYNVRSAGAQGNVEHDDTDAINSALKSGKIVFFPAGIYRVTGQIFIPVGSRIVGEAWSQIMGSGSYFGDAENPKVMIKVGNPGESGVIEIQDMIFTTTGATPGAIIMEWNVKQSSQGSAAMWDTHVRIGGARGTQLQAENCPKLTGTQKPECMSASMLLHMTKQSSAYLENCWFWVADHDLDIPSQTQVDVFSARGVLIESTTPSWFWGTASEHSTLYQYQLAGASNIFMGLVQTESPYYQSSPMAPLPWRVPKAGTTLFTEDPSFIECAGETSTEKTRCAVSWALRILDSTDVYLYGVGFYSWFQNYDQACVPLENCQARLIQTGSSEKIYMYGIATKGAKEVVSPHGTGLVPVLQPDNQNGYATSVAAWLPLAEPGSAALGKMLPPGWDFLFDDDVRNDAWALTSLGAWAAFGDSYSAGPGAGNYVPLYRYTTRKPGHEGQQKDCLIYSKSYPYLLANTRSPGYVQDLTAKEYKFQMNSCTGARAAAPPITEADPVIMDEEIDKLRGHEDFITLSIGGNDIGFSALADNCVFGFDPRTNPIYPQAYCEQLKQLAAAQLVENGPLQKKLEKTYSDIIYKYYHLNNDQRKPHFTIFITRYLSLFRVTPEAGQTTNCGDITFKYKPFWVTGLYNVHNDPKKLDQEQRQYWANLVDTLNARIDDAVNNVDRMGTMYANRLIIVTSTADEFTGHRFCEAGVTEPDYYRKDTWFYLPSILKLGSGKEKRDNAHISERQAVLTDSPYTADIDISSNANESEVLNAINDFMGPQYDLGGMLSTLADSNPTIDKRTFYDDYIKLGVGLVRTAHPTIEGFKATKWALCNFICDRFRRAKNCPPSPTNCPVDGI